MASSNDHTNTSGSLNRAYERVKHVMIDIENEPQDWSKTTWTIYRVSSNLRNLNEDAYTPQLVSIGPLHYGQEKLNLMQKQKLRYLSYFLDRVNNITAIDSFKEYLKVKEEDIRDCYYTEKLCDSNKEEFAEMMMLDSVFIMELFLRIQRKMLAEEITHSGEKHTYSDDIILKQSWLNKSIQRDLLLLENQIPWFVLNELYETVVPPTDKNLRTFFELAHNYFSYCPYKEDNWDSNYEPLHFTDMIRSSYIYKHHREFNFSRGRSLRSATKLQEAGVSFETVTNRQPLDIRFENNRILTWFLCLACIPKFKMVEARLEIPQLRIDHTVECVLRNFMAFEQCHYRDQPYFCNYVSLFDSLIHTKEDVNLLVEKEVIVHTLRSDTDVVTLMHGLVRNVVTDKTCYADKIEELNKYYTRMWWNRSMVEMRSVYFRDLWRASSTIIGLVIFMFTILNIYQTIHGFYVVKN